MAIRWRNVVASKTRLGNSNALLLFNRFTTTARGWERLRVGVGFGRILTVHIYHCGHASDRVSWVKRIPLISVATAERFPKSSARGGSASELRRMLQTQRFLFNVRLRASKYYRDTQSRIDQFLKRSLG